MKIPVTLLDIKLLSKQRVTERHHLYWTDDPVSASVVSITNVIPNRDSGIETEDNRNSAPEHSVHGGTAGC